MYHTPSTLDHRRVTRDPVNPDARADVRRPMRGWMGRVVMAAAAAGALVLACGDDGAKAPVTYPEQGPGGASSSGGPGGGDPGGGGASSSGGQGGLAKSFCPVFEDLYAKADACCTGADRDVNAYEYLKVVTAFSKAMCVILDASVASGRTKVDAAASSECVKALEDYAKGAACPYGAGLAPLLGVDRDADACRRSFIGTIAAGGGCKGDHECVSGLTCVGYTLTTDGTCVTPPAIDQPCGAARSDGGAAGALELSLGDHPKCATGAYCFVGKCVAALAPGEPCIQHDECDGTKCYQGTCGGAAGPSASGGPCKSTDDCEKGLVCHHVPGTAAGTCGAPKDAAQPCTGTTTGECKGRCELAADGGTGGSCVAWCGSD